VSVEFNKVFVPVNLSQPVRKLIKKMFISLIVFCKNRKLIKEKYAAKR